MIEWMLTFNDADLLIGKIDAWNEEGLAVGTYIA